jgi:hypothetical protein
MENLLRNSQIVVPPVAKEKRINIYLYVLKTLETQWDIGNFCINEAFPLL